MDEETTGLRWGVERRLEFIEFRLFWEGRLNRSDITDFFGVSVPQASKDLSLYQELASGNMDYDKSEKRYVAGPGFKPCFLKPDPDAYLAQLRSLTDGNISPAESWIARPPEADIALTPRRDMGVDVLREILNAVHDHRSVEVLYQSMNKARPKPLWRRISPHAFGYDGLRWHARAYCHLEHKFKDFLLPRMLGVRDPGAPGATGAQDRLWQEHFEIQIAPHPGLTAAQKRVVEKDYSMTNGKAVLSVRYAMVFYVLKRLGLLGNPEEYEARRQHIVALDKDDVQTALEISDFSQNVSQDLEPVLAGEQLMIALEDIRHGAVVRGIAPNQSVQVVSVDWIGNQAINVVFRDQNGSVSESTLYRDDEHRLALDAKGRPWSFDADGGLLRLVTEANRIKLAHYFDPYLAIHTSLVDPLPHQISAVYGEMLPRQPLRFLLADDPGAGKTIMAGLLMKELIARSDLERCLVVAPGSLVEQWQDELGEKFSLEFDILTREMMETSRSGNPFNDRNRLIVRLDVLARNEELQEKLLKSQEWDLIICDEAHRMSASYFGGDVKYTKRYQVGQKLGQICRHLLLMSATPHNGKEEDFQLFMALLDGDRFEGRFRDGIDYADTEDMMRRLTKEELLRFDGRPLFPERRAYTVKYELSAKEAKLYSAVTDYVRTEMNRVQRFTETDGEKRNNVGFALQILQRRLASSPAAIYQSLKRRRERLENELAEARLAARGIRAAFGHDAVSDDVLRNIEEYGQEEVDEIEDVISTGATTAETVEQLAIEVETLKGLEEMALRVLHSGEDTKWQQLNRILDDDLTIDKDGNRRKLIIFTEPKDTLHYLLEKVRSRIGRPEAVEVIHGGVTREERRKVIERFMQDRDMLVLIANDAAGEGVNLQRGHLMVNYDLPWNPNKIEQRFGRIHRIGQTEVCHLWNIVAADTREGEVYARLLEKLEAAREALGGRVYDVLGELFEGVALKDLLFEAIQYGEQEEVRARLFKTVDGAVDQSHLLELLRRRSLTNDTMPEAKVQELRLEMERAEAQRLQPHHIQSFFVEAFQHLGGKLKKREEGRWEITHVPVRIRERDRQIGMGAPIQKKYERICFEKNQINQQPVATFVCPGHPLLEAVISIIREDYDQLMKQGAILVDEIDPGTDLSAIFLLEHSVQDGCRTSTGNPHIISQKLQFAAIDRNGNTVSAGIAPHLNLRPAKPDEIALVEDLLTEDWLTSELERTAVQFATVELAQRHVADVKARRVPEIAKVEQEVKARLKKEINYWDSRAFELQEEEKAGRKTRLNWQNARRRAEDLAERLKRRQAQLEEERFITSQPPRVRGGMVVIPKGLLEARGAASQDSKAVPSHFADDPAARREIELAAMDAVMTAERKLGNVPTDVSAQKIGYDITSYSPATQHLRFIEVKGRVDGADTVMVTRQEVITSLHEPEKFILAIVQVENGFARDPHYVRRPFSQEPEFCITAIQVKLNSLLERAEAPS